jgi:hypothetical protein
MKTRHRTHAALFASLIMTASSAPALAQVFNDLKNAAGTLSSDVGALQAGSLSNVVGILEYCLKNQFLSNDSASSLKDSLMSKLTGTTGQPAQQDSGYLAGAKGLLQAGNGSTVDLSAKGLETAASQQICNTILNQAKSFL